MGIKYNRFLLFVLILTLCNCNARKSKDNGIRHFTENVNDPNIQPFVVPSLIKNGLHSFAGFLNGTTDAKMFFWFFPSQNGPNSPLIVWLQGDIGTSSVKAVFENNGPFYVKPIRGLHSRKHYWSQKFSVVYLDTTIGAGFSHGVSPSYFSNMNQVLNNLEVTLDSFLKLFKNWFGAEVYLAGDGFACPLIAKLGKRMDESHSDKLKGLILENGICDPLTTLNVANYFYNLGILDAKKTDVLLKEEKQIITLLKANKFEQAFDKYDTYIKGLLTSYRTKFNNYTMYTSSHNLLYTTEHRSYGSYINYMNKEMIRKYLHVHKDVEYRNGEEAVKKLKGELMKSSLKDLGYLLNKYNILFYYGQMNPEVSPKGAYQTFYSIKWCGSDYVGDENYTPWFVDNKVAGYIVDALVGGCKGSLSWALVLNAGKDIADDKPRETVDLIQKFISQSLPSTSGKR